MNHMNTTFHFTIACDKKDAFRAEAVLRECHREVSLLERELSEYLPQSQVFVLNHSNPSTKVPFCETASRLFLKAIELEELTQKAFSPFVKSAAPGDEVFSYERLQDRTISVQKNWPGSRLSFAAIGKGFALDGVRELIERAGFEDYLLTAGGSSLVLSGFASPNVNWQWGWSWKKSDTGEALGCQFEHFRGKKTALGVSGRHEKGNHLIDPRTRRPVIEGLSSLVSHSSAATADALSTALFVLGWDCGKRAFATLLDKPALAFIDEKEIPSWNGTFQENWGEVPC